MIKYGNSLRFLLSGLLVLLVDAAACTGPAESNLEVSSAWARAAVAGTMAMMDGEADKDAASTEMPSGDMSEGGMMAHSGNVSAAYMTITNTGNAADRLVSVTTDAATVAEIHTVEVVDEVARMIPLPDGLEIPANGTVSLEPGSYHIMMMDLQEDLVAGKQVALTLNFESGKTLTVEAEIQEP